MTLQLITLIITIILSAAFFAYLYLSGLLIKTSFEALSTSIIAILLVIAIGVSFIISILKDDFGSAIFIATIFALAFDGIVFALVSVNLEDKQAIIEAINRRGIDIDKNQVMFFRFSDVQLKNAIQRFIRKANRARSYSVHLIKGDIERKERLKSILKEI